jgi:hypothetical protein
VLVKFLLTPESNTGILGFVESNGNKTMADAAPRASYTGTSGLWHGAVKVGKDVVWTCPHTHRNRDQSTRTNGRAACDCASSALRVALMSADELSYFKATHRTYMNGGMSPRMPWNIDFELRVRDEIRAAIGLKD